MKIIVSACLAGDNCKYNGGNNFNQKMMNFLQAHEMIKVCPEVLGGLPIPRPSAEIVDGQVMNTEGRNITKEFSLGAQKVFEIVKKENPDLIILQSRSHHVELSRFMTGLFLERKSQATVCLQIFALKLDLKF